MCKCWPSLAHHNSNTFKLDLNLSFKPAGAGGLWLAATLCVRLDGRLYVCECERGSKATFRDRSGRHSRYDPGHSSMVHRRLSACLNTHTHTHSLKPQTHGQVLPGRTALKLPHPWLPHTHIFSVATIFWFPTPSDTHTYEHLLTLQTQLCIYTHKYVSHFMCQSF